jgi:ribonuclease J
LKKSVPKKGAQKSVAVKEIKKNIKFKESEVYFIPLGGCGEIGMNLSLYGTGNDWIVADCGITFSHKPEGILLPEVEQFLPHLKKIHALVLTHGHEDHLGAVPYLIGLLKCPIYATPFTAFLLREKFQEHHISPPIVEVPLKGSFHAGPFHIEAVSLTHSIPEPNALIIKVKDQTIFHTGDWKIDPYPLIGEATDIKKLIELGEQGITAMVCDSTNVFEEGHSGSEQTVSKMLIETVGNYPEGKVVIACFASNVARIFSCYQAAVKNGRHIVLAGRSMNRMKKAAEYCGYFSKDMVFLTPEQAQSMSPSKLLVVTTGSQAEPRAALTTMAQGRHPFVQLNAEDTVIFSSRVIPGNEQAIYELQNNLTLRGVRIVTPKKGSDLHVSGHPHRDELIQMYGWLKPRISIPVHGEDRHIYEHAKLAHEIGVPHVIRPHNGQLYCLSGDAPRLVETFPSGRLFVDGKRLLPIKGTVINERLRLLDFGILYAVMIFSRQFRKIIERHLDFYGVCGSAKDAEELREDILKRLRDRLPEKVTLDEVGQLENHFYQQLRLVCKEILGKDPIIKVKIVWA